TALNLGTTAPTDLAPLRTVPNLRCLDLSRAAATDLAVLTEVRRSPVRPPAVTGRSRSWIRSD
ncbi:hypothetical protein ACFWXO_38420, partial [Kitasatospora sp. NPDC059088]|uniref:hypothetical protein n=1 Tax=Kitasatospora sp. NPDC059088 TaxID=3346722 RepID=UPI003690C9F4